MKSHWTILTFCFFYIMVQLTFIAHAHFSDDKRFGFWMFAESTVFKAELYRVTEEGERIKTRNGVWRLRANGKRVVYSWNKFVRDYRLDQLERDKRAKGSMSRTLKFLDASLDYVADQIVDDKETRQLLLVVTYRKAGGEEQQEILESKMRVF